eukprot:5940051-Ditylum_brightwellii.AAC.1
MVFIPFLQFPTPCTSLPNSLAQEQNHVCLCLDLIRWQYLSAQPLSLSIMALTHSSHCARALVALPYPFGEELKDVLLLYMGMMLGWLRPCTAIGGQPLGVGMNICKILEGGRFPSLGMTYTLCSDLALCAVWGAGTLGILASCTRVL